MGRDTCVALGLRDMLIIAPHPPSSSPRSRPPSPASPWPVVSAMASAGCQLRLQVTLTVADTALRGTNLEAVDRATTCAKVVFPQPGGPQRMTEGSLSAASSLPMMD
jgi:hypothetical protein